MGLLFKMKVHLWKRVCGKQYLCRIWKSKSPSWISKRCERILF